MPAENPTREFETLLDRLEAADASARRTIRTELLKVAGELLARLDGLQALWDLAPRFDGAGLFEGSPWAVVSDLQVPLVAGSLRGPGLTPVLETLSELRVLALATGRSTSAATSREAALTFLEEVVARNLHYLFETTVGTEQDRVEVDANRQSNLRLFALIVDEIGIGRVLDEVVVEIEQLLVQRPLSTRDVVHMIEHASHLAHDQGLEGPHVDALARYRSAAATPSPLSRRHVRFEDYRCAVVRADAPTLEVEARACAESMMQTALVAPVHAVLLRTLASASVSASDGQDLLGVALGIEAAGTDELEHNLELVRRLIEHGICASTAQSIYGLGRALDLAVFSRPGVAASLTRLLDTRDEELHEDARANLVVPSGPGQRVCAVGVLVAGTVAVLGQPLGVAQGHNPTCQSARGISLWAQRDPAHLIRLIHAAAVGANVTMEFNGAPVHSADIQRGLAQQIDADLDPVSSVLVPHLDRLYAEFMRRSRGRSEDAHKWVNPALYGDWIAPELTSAFADVAQTRVGDFATFVRTFYAAFHPDFVGERPPDLPCPVGIAVTTHRARYLGLHAVSIQRVVTTPRGETRVYFLNPNNDNRQDWGAGVVVSVTGNGEQHGESSLPFSGFAARVYAFHHAPVATQALAAVPDVEVKRVTRAARVSWGQRFVWDDD